MPILVKFFDSATPLSREFGPLQEVLLNGCDIKAVDDGEIHKLATRCESGGWHVPGLDKVHFRQISIEEHEPEWFEQNKPREEACQALGTYDKGPPPF